MTDADVKKRVTSCGGPEGGAFLRATRGDGGCTLTDGQFVAAVKYTLGLPVMAACACQHSTQRQGGPRRTCGERADRLGHHAVMCKVGGRTLCCPFQRLQHFTEGSLTSRFPSSARAGRARVGVI